MPWKRVKFSAEARTTMPTVLLQYLGGKFITVFRHRRRSPRRNGR